MAIITVSPEILRQKAHLIRTLLEQSKMDHDSLWGQINAQVGLLPKDLRASHAHANNPWHTALTTFYENYLQIALAMEAAADAYEHGEQTIQISFAEDS